MGGGLSTELKDLMACVVHQMAGRPRVRGGQDKGQEGLKAPGRVPCHRPAVPHAAQRLWLICPLPASAPLGAKVGPGLLLPDRPPTP